MAPPAPFRHAPGPGEEFLARTAEALVCRACTSNVIPGFFQTAGYAGALMRSITDFQGTPDDITEAVAACLACSRHAVRGRPPLRRPHRGVGAAHPDRHDRDDGRPARPPAHRECRCRRSFSASSRSASSYRVTAGGVLPPRRPAHRGGTADRVGQRPPAPRTRLYARAFTALAKLALHGDAARARIRAAIDALE
ncbi:Scr1 family TA system antitoxin-like transcriptional regulator [Streptomyces thermolilacinus]